jgi:DNA-binding transcriptional ArsR family regulator
MDEVFKVLADPNRRKLLDSLNARGGQIPSELCSVLDMARQSGGRPRVLANLKTLLETGEAESLWVHK